MAQDAASLAQPVDGQGFPERRGLRNVIAELAQAGRF